jgi:bifunctional ADP-heptose synthase (sugar kinase/adenylyltransferase)
LDLKNWTATPPVLESKIAAAIAALAGKVDALIVLDQVDQPRTGVVTTRVLNAIKRAASRNQKLIVLADSRRGLRGFPPFIYKMNRAELGALTGNRERLSMARDLASTLSLAKKNNRPVFVTLAEQGILGAFPTGEVQHVPALPLRGPIDIVGAGDAVTANLVAALASAATLREALEMAMAAASVVIHKLGTTGTASREESRRLIRNIEPETISRAEKMNARSFFR